MNGLSRGFLLCLLIVSTMTWTGGARAQEQQAWTVQSVSGDAMHSVNGGSAFTLQHGSTVGAGSKVVTGPASRVVLSRGTTSISLSPGSEITIAPSNGSAMTQILQRIGTLLFKVEKRLREHFEVKTPHLNAEIGRAHV